MTTVKSTSERIKSTKTLSDYYRKIREMNEFAREMKKQGGK